MINKLKFFILFFIILIVYIFYSLFVNYNYKFQSKELKINIEHQSDLNDLINLLEEKGSFYNIWSFRIISKLKDFDKNIRTGIVYLNGEYTNNELINKLRIPTKNVFQLQIPENIRLIDEMIILLEDSIGYNRGELKTYLDTSNFLLDNNLNLQTLPAFFIPNTYELYEGLSISSFLDRMKREYDIFWNNKRLYKCDSLGISKIDVSILASIVEEEQDKRLDERPMIAGLYLNRLKNPQDYPYLQADPTVKFANKDFSIKQVLYKHTRSENPYNTYKYKGLPPGPICIPSINSIDAVLNAVKHDYYFMCAGSNGDGYHKFTSSNKEHNKNKNLYKKYQNFK